MRASLLACGLALSACDAVPSARAAELADAAQIVGQPAPDFTLTDTEGGSFTLSEHRGQAVVLEWFNPDCPFVKHAYDDGPLQGLAGRWAKQGVVWVAVNSGKPGKQGAGADRNAKARADWGMAAPVLLDESGDVGRSYGAKTTPQIAVVAPSGALVYNGALDNAPLGRVSGGEHEVYPDAVLQKVTAGADAPFGHRKPYGCSVKY